MSQSRKFKRSRPGYQAAPRAQVPPDWEKTQGAAREEAARAMRAVQELLPGRGIILLTVPEGTSTQDVEAMACVNNLTDRSQVASVFEAMLEWWSPQVVTAQPDRAAVAALREGVAAVSEIPIDEVCKQLGLSVTRLLKAVNARQPGTAEGIVHETLLIAVSALGIFAKFHAPQQHAVPGFSADGSGAPPPAPMPPPRQWPKGNTKETLVADLLERPQSEHRDQLIAMAREGKFHDYDAEVATPKALLIDVLARFGFADLAGKARDGGYDDERPTMEQSEELRVAVGTAAYDSMIGGKPRGTA